MLLYAGAVLCTILMILSLILIFLGLPGTWVIIGFVGLWAFFAGAGVFTWQFFALLVGAAVFGEIAEFLAGYFGGKRYGGTNQGSLGGIVGAIAGAILGAPILFGLGALPGALLGCFIGCFLVEKGRGMDSSAAARAAWGATLGRFGGFVVKLSIGVGIIWIAAPKIWESAGTVAASV